MIAYCSKIEKGDPAGQARVEALMLAIALRTWKDLLLTTQGALAVRGDALGILMDVVNCEQESQS